MYRYGHQELLFDHNLYIRKYLCLVFHLFCTLITPPFKMFCEYIPHLYMTPNAKYFIFIFIFSKIRPFALFFDNGFSEKDNKILNFSLTNHFRGVIVTKKTDEVKVMKTYLFRKQDMQKSWLAMHDYDYACRLIPLYSFWDK